MIISSKELESIRRKHAGQSIVFLDGVFDLMHVGHIEAFKRLRTQGEIVVVGVLSDERVTAIKGYARPIMGEEERLHLVDSVRHIDYAVLLKDRESGERIRTSHVIQSLQPDLFVSTDAAWTTLFSQL